MGYRRQQNDPQHVFVHGKGDWEQEALRRQRNFQFAVRIVMTSFFVVIDFLRNVYKRFFPSHDEAIALGRYIDEYGQEGEIDRVACRASQPASAYSGRHWKGEDYAVGEHGNSTNADGTFHRDC